MGMDTGNTSKVSAIFLASVLLFSTVSIASLAGMTPLPNAYAGGDNFSFPGSQCNIDPIPSDDEGDDTAMTFWASEGVFLWANRDDLYRLTVGGEKTFIGSMDHDSKGLAFSLDGNTLFSIEKIDDDDKLHIVDPSDASSGGSTKTITLAGETVRGGNALVTHPTTGELWAVLKISGQDGRELVTIDPSDGVATSKGDTGERINGLAFTAGGQLFATTGNGANIGNSLYTANTSNANLTFLCVFSGFASCCGTSIALNTNDNVFYISAIGSQFFKFFGGTITPCATEKITNNINREITGMTFWESEGVFLIAGFSSLFELTLDAVETFIGSIRVPSSFSQSSKGLAFSLDGNTLFSIDRRDDQLHVVDPTDASIDSTKTITLSGETVRGGTGLATHPTTGELWAILKINGQSGRELVTIDPSDGKATSKGTIGLKIAGIAFDSSGTLFGVTGDGGAPAETLVTISQTDGTPTLVCGLGSGLDGEVIAFNPNDGLLYHMSGSGSTIFEKIVGFSGGSPTVSGLTLFSIDRFDPLIHVIDPITGNVIKTTVINYEFALNGGNALATDSSNQMFAVLDPREGGEGEDKRLATINPTTGQATDIGPLDNKITALAFNEGTLFGLTGHRNSGPVGDGWLVSINENTAEVTPICELDRFAREMHIANNPTDNLLYFFANDELRGKIVDIQNCTVEAPGGFNGFEFIFEYVSYALISIILPSAEAGEEGGECFDDSDVNTRAATFWEAESTFLAAGECFGTIDPDTGDKALINELDHRSKGLAFATVGGGGAGGGHGNPTIGVNDEGILVVTCGVNFDGKCFTITAPFHEEFKLYEMMSGTHTISITMYCANGVTTCNYAAIAIMPYSESMDNTTWKIELYKDNEGNLTTVTTDPEGYLGTVTVTTQILDDKFWIVSFTVDFKNKDTGPMMFGVQVRDNYNALRNWYLNEGVEFIDSDAYPSILTEFDESLEIDSLCLNEDPTYRYSCAFAEIRDRAIQLAEETLWQMLNGEYTYK